MIFLRIFLFTAFIMLSAFSGAYAQLADEVDESLEPFFDNTSKEDTDAPYVKELKEKAEDGDVSAQNELANAYFVGIGTEKNIDEAMRWWSAAASTEDGKASSMLGTMYYLGIGTAKNTVEAIKYWEIGAAKQDLDAMSQLGFVYLLGDTVKKNIKVAYMWFNLAASKGDTQAIKQRDLIAKQLSAMAIDEAQHMGVEWQRQNSNK